MLKEKKNVIAFEEPSEPIAERLAHWLQQYGTALSYGVSGLLILFLLLYFWSYRTSGYDEQDYLQAQVSYREFSALPPDQADPASTASFTQLKSILESHPDLATRYDGLIAQTFLRLGDMKDALSYGQLALENLANESLPFYEDYSKTSLLIADGNRGEALKRAEFLSKRMKESSAKAGKDVQKRGFGDILLIYNLIRIGMLQQSLGNAQGELAAWQDFQQLSAKTEKGKSSSYSVDEDTLARAVAAFKIGKIGLNEYVDARMKALRR